MTTLSLEGKRILITGGTGSLGKVLVRRLYARIYFDHHLYWNEQYLLQAFLTYNSHFEVLWAGNYLIHKYRERLCSRFQPEYELMREAYPLAEPSSLWMSVRGGM